MATSRRGGIERRIRGAPSPSLDHNFPILHLTMYHGISRDGTNGTRVCVVRDVASYSFQAKLGYRQLFDGYELAAGEKKKLLLLLHQAHGKLALFLRAYSTTLFHKTLYIRTACDVS